MTVREVPLAAPPIIHATTMLKKRSGIATFEFEEGRHCSIAGQRGVGIETIREPLDLHRVPAQPANAFKATLAGMAISGSRSLSI